MNPKEQIENASLSDAELFSQIAASQVAALSGLYDRYADRLYGLACKILNNDAQAEDVLQDLFVYIWQNAGKFDRKRGASLPWLFVLCRNRCIDKLRANASKSRQMVPIDDHLQQYLVDDERPDPSQAVDIDETSRNIRNALNQIPAEQREPILLAYFEGLSQTEIAGRLGLPVGTVKTRVRLGMQKLRMLLVRE